MFAVSQFTTMPCSAQLDLKLYADADVEAIELCEAKYPPSERERRELVARLKDLPMEVVSVQAEVHSIFPDRMAKEPCSPAKRLERFKRSIGYWTEALEQPDLPFVLIAGVAPDQNLREAWDVGKRWMRDAARFAESAGARIAFEPLSPCMMYHDTFLWGLDQGTRMMEAAESKAAGLVVDAFHIWEEPDLPRRLEELAPRVLLVHACDWPEGGPRGLDDRTLPGDGVIQLRELIFEPLRTGGYRGPWVVEVLSDEALEGSLWAMDPRQLLEQAKTVMARY